MYNLTRNQQRPCRGGRHQPTMPMSATNMQQWPLQQPTFHETFNYSTNPIPNGFVGPGPYAFSIPPPQAFQSQNQYLAQYYGEGWDQHFVAEPPASYYTFSPDASVFTPFGQQDYNPTEPHQVASAGRRSANLLASSYHDNNQTQHQYRRNTNKHNQGGYYGHQENQFSSAQTKSGAQCGRYHNTKPVSYDQKRNQERTMSEGMTKSKMDAYKVAKSRPSWSDAPHKQTQVNGASMAPSRQSTKPVSRLPSSNSMYEPIPDQGSESGRVTLDRYNSDLYLTIAKDGLSASTMTSPSGFRLLWGGARATHGACRGKVMFEVRVAQYLESRVDGGFSVPHPNLVRVGWSEDSPNFELGEGGESYGYGGLGKCSHNGVFEDYGEPFGPRDVITALLDLDGSSGTVAFMKNGRHLGVAHTLTRATQSSRPTALFPHVSCKNAKVEVNFGKEAPWAQIPDGYTFIGRLPVGDRVRGLEPPKSKSDCEVIAMIGLPGCGKTTWALQKQKDCPHKRYNILGTDDYIEKFEVHVMRSYSEKFSLLYKKANDCFNELLKMSTQHARNYILDQTNLYPSARKRKIGPFKDFLRVAVVIQPEISELEARAKRVARETGKSIPPGNLREMKANYILPSANDAIFNRIIYVELDEPKAQAVVKRFNRK